VAISTPEGTISVSYTFADFGIVGGRLPGGGFVTGGGPDGRTQGQNRGGGGTQNGGFITGGGLIQSTGFLFSDTDSIRK
jgi:hypothetical protein